MEEVFFFRDNILPSPLKPKHEGLWFIKVDGDVDNIDGRPDTFNLSIVKGEKNIPLRTPVLSEVTRYGAITPYEMRVKVDQEASTIGEKGFRSENGLEKVKYFTEYIETEKDLHKPIRLKFPVRDFNSYSQPGVQDTDDFVLPVMINGQRANSRGEIVIQTGETNFQDSNSIRRATNSFVRKALTGDVLAEDNSNITKIAPGVVDTNNLADKAVTLDKISVIGSTVNDIMIRTLNGWEYIQYQSGGGGGGDQNLQSVTDYGNQTNKTIIVKNNNWTSTLKHGQLLLEAGDKKSENTPDDIQYTPFSGANTSHLKYPYNADSGGIDAFIPVSVNGVHANAKGEIHLSRIVDVKNVTYTIKPEDNGRQLTLIGDEIDLIIDPNEYSYPENFEVLVLNEQDNYITDISITAGPFTIKGNNFIAADGGHCYIHRPSVQQYFRTLGND